MASLPVLPTRTPEYGRHLRPAVKRVAVLLVVLVSCTAFFARKAMLRADTAAAAAAMTRKVGPEIGLDRQLLVSNKTSLSGTDILSRAFARRIIVSERSRLIYCPIPKAASSNWKYLIRKFEGFEDYFELTKAHSPETSGLRYLSDYSPDEVDRLLSDPSFFKFTFVRDPYSRAMSCYMNKFQNRDEGYVRTEYRNFLAQLFDWRYANSVDIEAAPRPSFSEFVDELAKQNPMSMNEHWMPQTLLCGFGEMPYDFVGHMETLEDDAAYALGRIGRPNEKFPSQEDIGFPKSGASPSVADDLQTIESMMKLRVIFDLDFNSILKKSVYV